MDWLQDRIKEREERKERERETDEEGKKEMEEHNALVRKSNSAKLKTALDRFCNFEREMKKHKEYACKADSKHIRDAKSGEDYISESILYVRTRPLRQGPGQEKELAKNNSPYISIKAEGTAETFTLEKRFEEAPRSSEGVRIVRIPDRVIDASVIDEGYVDKLIQEFVTEVLRKQ